MSRKIGRHDDEPEMPSVMDEALVMILFAKQA